MMMDNVREQEEGEIGVVHACQNVLGTDCLRLVYVCMYYVAQCTRPCVPGRRICLVSVTSVQRDHLCIQVRAEVQNRLQHERLDWCGCGYPVCHGILRARWCLMET